MTLPCWRKGESTRHSRPPALRVPGRLLSKVWLAIILRQDEGRQRPAASSRALLDLAANPRRLDAQLGTWGVLHTWTRTLVYHPHIHYLVPAGGLSLDGPQWVSAHSEFLVRVEPLSDHFRTCFRQRLAPHASTALATIPPQVWSQRWVTHSQPAGSGQNALRYLSRYMFQTTPGHRRLDDATGAGVAGIGETSGHGSEIQGHGH